MIGWNEEIKKHLGSCGENVFIGQNVIFTQPQNVHLGNNVRIDPFTMITSKLKTGNNVQICSHAILGGSGQFVILDDWTFIGYGSKLFTASEDYSGNHGPVNEYWGDNKTYKGDIIFNKYCGVASDVMVFPGVELPEGVCIGAKSLVVKGKYKTPMDSGFPDSGFIDVPMKPYTVYSGNPLTFHKQRNKDKIHSFAELFEREGKNI